MKLYTLQFTPQEVDLLYSSLGVLIQNMNNRPEQIQVTQSALNLSSRIGMEVSQQNTVKEPKEGEFVMDSKEVLPAKK